MERIALFLLLLILACVFMGGCRTTTSAPEFVPIPGGEREYCEEKPDAPICRHL